ncbi:hypothetical protein FHS04_002298 [Mesoflavibacter sabulilitoris]|uniref:Carboxypeptidase regulatory-like domain-containing protein n=1 Tax=Mesoflavibacter zeaxanthinifaciens subsp. sabulilitoris TaxID=1520893 RepID=A0A2T1NFC1_9FLAO|nr:carboxypeptidase-like regulatory domain-containing protein [Mesoflavibacter zeaxanthinifaciens]MBB3124771.1 hypothetical protein [Mesoflavibacter zeaxanthinifaciens subsp. sabulilitoris]PSG91135.1 hypothetical protein C7H61_07745 [Mesoflavibacter zeaxanthinifaciens subsp. sabulilitoris]
MKTTNKTSKQLLAILLVISAFFYSCEKNESIDDPYIEDPSGSTLNQGASIQRSFMGRIVNQSNLALDNVNITIGTKTAVTDSNGYFIINDVTVSERQAFILAEKPGFLNGMRSVVPTQGVNQVKIMMVTENLAGTVASGTSSEVTLTNGTKVAFDGNFKDENGNAYSGNVDVYMYHLDPANPEVENIMPGNLQAQNTNGQERLLETYGMINVELKGDSGQKLNIADASVAEIELPIDPAQSGVAPSTIPLWHFDEVNGYWVEDGQATLSGGKYVGQVSHFSWWNCDAQFPTVNLCLNVVDNANSPLSSVRVELWRNGAVYPRVGISDGNGEICGLIPANETLTLKAFDQCSVEVYSTTIGPFSSDTNLGNIVLATVTSTTITGNLVDCSNANVTNGYVVMDYGNQEASAQITNGAFSFSVLQCPSVTDFTIEGVDYDAFQTTNLLNYNFSNTSIGNIIACNAVTEFISIQVDTDPVEYFIANINTDQYTQGSGFSVNANSGSAGTNEWFYLGVGDTTLGTYAISNNGVVGIEANIDMDYSIPNTLQFTLSSYGAVGQYIDGTVTGTFTDNSGNVRTLSITIHVLRDS